MTLPAVETSDLSLAADAAHAVNPWVALAYLAAGVLFILALRGLSSPASSCPVSSVNSSRAPQRSQST